MQSAPPATRAAVSRAEARSRMLRTSRLLVLLRADEVGVAGPRQVDLGDRRVDRPGAHPLLPVGVVAVGDLQRDRAAERAPVTHAARDLGRVALDLHAPSAAVAELAARHVAVEVLGAQLEARGQALDDAGQAGAVRLAGGYQTERHLRPSLFAGGSASVVASCVGARGERRMPGEHEAARPRASSAARTASAPGGASSRAAFACGAEGVADARGRGGARGLVDARELQFVGDRAAVGFDALRASRSARPAGRSPGTGSALGWQLPLPCRIAAPVSPNSASLPVRSTTPRYTSCGLALPGSGSSSAMSL